MPTITKKELEQYRQICYDKNNGRILTPEGFRFIREVQSYAPKAIGKHFFEILSRIQNK